MDDSTPQPEAKPKMSKTQWLEVKARAESGEAYEAIASQYPVVVQTIKDRASQEQWCTPARIQRGVRGELAKDDPAAAAATVWVARKEQARETVFQGAKRSLERFFAMAPVPQSFGEAAIAAKLMNEAITPPEENQSSGNVNLAILTAVGFTPRVSDD